MNRILLEPDEVDANGAVCLTGRRADHLLNVLQVVPGRTVRVGILGGTTGSAAVTTVEAGRIRLVCRLDPPVPPGPVPDLLLAVPRPKVLRRLWAPLAELGVRRVVLTNAEQVERVYFDTHWLHPDVIRTEWIKGLEQQAVDTHLPEVRVCKQLKPFIEDELETYAPGSLRLLADPAETVTDVGSLPAGKHCLVAVGPEGGWSAYERDLFQAHGFQVFSLGPRMLKVDTACVAVLSVLAINRTGL